MTFQIRGLAPEQFTHLFSLSDAALSFPCRVSLQDAAIGEALLLLNFAHLKTTSAYQANGPIFVRRHALLAPLFVDTLPPMLDQAHRLFSVRTFDSADRMVDAEVASGSELQALLTHFLSQPEVNYLHVHFARRGCFAARVDRTN